MKRRILIFSTAYFPLIGGAEIAVKEITDRLPEYEFVMVTARIDSKLPIHDRHGNVECYRIGSGNFFDKYRLVIEGARFAETLGRFDAVWGIMASYAGFAALRYKERHPQVPYLLTIQEGDSRWDIYKHVWWCWPYFKKIFTRADRIQAISTYLAAWAKKLGATCPVDVVPNGVALARFAAPAIPLLPEPAWMNLRSDGEGHTPPSGGGVVGAISRASLGIPADARVVVTSSRLVPKNDVSSLVMALAFLSQNVHLLIVGSGKEEEHLRTLAVRQHLTDRVHMAGRVLYEQLPQYLRTADVFCRPSVSEGLGNAFLDAMAVGLPIVGTRVGGIPDFLTDGETGLFCRVHDPRDIAEKIEKILTDPALAEQLRTNGLALVKEKYQWDAIAHRMGKIFSSV